MPLTDSKGQNIPYPLLTDRANIETAGGNMAEAVAEKVVMTFASASVRNATLTEPTSGMTTWLQDTSRMEIFDGNEWRPVSVNPRVGFEYTVEVGGDFALGNGWTYGSYVRMGNWVQATAMVYCGSTSRVTGNGNMYLNLPIAPAHGPREEPVNYAGQSVINPGSGNFWAAGCWTYGGRQTTNAVTMNVMSGGAYKAYGVTSLTFQAGGWISMNIMYLGV